jgi:sulfite oxidase
MQSSFLTSTKEDTYDRNHGPILHKTKDGHVVIVDGLVPKELRLSIEALTNNFPQHSVTCALQCAGNRRHSMRTRIKEVAGVDWFDAAIMNCVFEGPRLRDVLLAAGVKDNDPLHGLVQRKHVQFANYGAKVQEDDWYGGSIPFERAMDPSMDVILALKVCLLPVRARLVWGAQACVQLLIVSLAPPDEWRDSPSSSRIPCSSHLSRRARRAFGEMA